MKTTAKHQGQWVAFCATSLELLRLLGKKYYTLIFNRTQNSIFIYPFKSRSDASKLLIKKEKGKDYVIADAEALKTLIKEVQSLSARVLIPPSL
jgi:hypothetical protein